MEQPQDPCDLQGAVHTTSEPSSAAPPRLPFLPSAPLQPTKVVAVMFVDRYHGIGPEATCLVSARTNKACCGQGKSMQERQVIVNREARNSHPTSGAAFPLQAPAETLKSSGN